MSLKTQIEERSACPREIALLLGVSISTVRKYLKAGRLNLTPLPGYGELRFDLEEVKKAVQEFKPPRMGRPVKVAS